MAFPIVTAVAALVLAASFPANAQMAIETAFAGQPLIYAKDGKLHGCGVRLVSVDSPTREGQPSIVIDASMQLDLMLTGILVKVTARRALFVGGKLEVQSTPTVERAWFRSDGIAPTKPQAGTLIPTQEPVGGILYRTDAMVADMNTLLAMIGGKPIELGMKLEGETGETIRFGVVTLSTAESARVQSCLTDLLADAKKK